MLHQAMYIYIFTVSMSTLFIHKTQLKTTVDPCCRMTEILYAK